MNEIPFVFLLFGPLYLEVGASKDLIVSSSLGLPHRGVWVNLSEKLGGTLQRLLRLIATCEASELTTRGVDKGGYRNTTATPFPDGPTGLEGQVTSTHPNSNTGGQTMTPSRPKLLSQEVPYPNRDMECTNWNGMESNV